MTEWFAPLVSALSLLFAAGGYARSRTHDASGLERRLTKLETQMELLMPWAAAKMLHSPDDHRGMDELLDRFLNEQLERDDVIHLVHSLQRILRENSHERDRAAAHILLSVLAERYGVGLD